jgi:CRISPR-associated protein Csm2
MGYFDQAGNIIVELLDQKAKTLAEGFVVRNPKDPKKVIFKQTLHSAQLRRFFGEFRQLEKKVKSMDFEKVKPLIKMVKSKASYAANPDNPKIPESFKKFLINNIDEINTRKDFEAFMLHFEAVVGFFYGIEGAGKN